MMKIELTGLKKLFLSERAFLSIFVFVFLNWLSLANIEKLAHPDYYVYYKASEKLFSGDFRLGFIPPLFPFLLGIFGRIIGLVPGNTDSFILGGRIISLFAGLGVVYFSFKLLQKLVGGYAVMGTIILVISPFFLKLLSIPQTDMLYLFFICAAFYFFFSGNSRLNSGWAAVGCLLTRFEGVLLVGSAFINHVNFRKKRWIYYAISLIPLTLVLYFLFLGFAPRLIDTFNYVVSKSLYLYYFKHPQELGHLFYGNFLFFISPKFPGFLKWLFLYMLLIGFFTGLYYLFKIKWQFALAILFYELSFIIFKGYAATLDPEVEFRRMFSVIWIFYILAFIGIYYLFKKISSQKKFSVLCRVLLYSFLTITALFLPLIKGTSLLLFLVLVPALIYGITRFKLKKTELIVLFLIPAVFLGQFYFDSGKRAFRYVKNNTNKAGFVISLWLNGEPVREDILVYSYLPMVQYYLEKPVSIRHFFFLDERIYKNREKLTAALLKRAKKYQVRYIVFDEYLNPEEGYFLVAIQNMLYEEKEKLHRGIVTEEESYFKLIKTLLYKGRPVAWVLKPLYERLRPNME